MRAGPERVCMRRAAHTGSRVVLTLSWGLLLASVSVMTASEPPPPIAPGAFSETMPADLTVRRALIIGSNRCADLRVPDARLPVTDARWLHKTLTDPRIGRFSPSNVSLLVGDDANLANIRKEFARLRHADFDDIVMVYLSAYTANESGKVFWLTRETIVGNMADTALSNAELGLLLKSIPSRNVVVVLDALDASVAGTEAKIARADLNALMPTLASDGHGVLAFQHIGNRSRETDGVRHDILTHYLVRGLCGAADGNGDGSVSTAELWRYVEYQLGQEAAGTSGLPVPMIRSGTGFRGDRLFLTLNPDPENVSRLRLESLMKLLGQGMVSGADYDEARRLLTSKLLRDRERLQRDIYADLADGRIDADSARLALSALAVSKTAPETTEGTLFASLPASRRNSLRMDMVLIPEGTYQMGSAQSASDLSVRFGGPTEWFEPEYPRHAVRVSKPLYMSTCEVTVAQFRAFVEETGYRTDAEKGGQSFENGNRGGFTVLPDGTWGWRETATWRSPGFDQTDDDPVVMVSWNDTDMFCKWLSARDNHDYRLPTEAEWEYACRAGGQHHLLVGRRFPRPRGQRGRRPDPVGQLLPHRRDFTHPSGRQTPGQRLRPPRHGRQHLGMVQRLVWPQLLRRVALRRPPGALARLLPRHPRRRLARQPPLLPILLPQRLPPPPAAMASSASASSLKPNSPYSARCQPSSKRSVPGRRPARQIDERCPSLLVAATAKSRTSTS